MPQTLSRELKGLIKRRPNATKPDEVLAIVSALAAVEEVNLQQLAAPAATSSPLPRFEIIDVDQVLDTSTGLIWTRANVPGGRMKHPEAYAACRNLRLGGSDMWRLPTSKELFSIVDHDRSEP